MNREIKVRAWDKNNNIKQLKEFLNAIDKNLKTC